MADVAPDSPATAVREQAVRRRRVFVESEFAPLRTVVVARSQVRLPDRDCLTPEQLGVELAILPPAEREMMTSLLGRDLGDAAPGLQKMFEEERAGLQRLLERHGVEVLLPALLTESQKQAGGRNGYSNFFVRDPWFTVGDTVIEASLRYPHRRLEMLPSRLLMEREVYPADCAYVATPRPDVVPSDREGVDGGPYLEGGDVIVLGRHVFVGHSGRATSPAGVAFLRKQLEPKGYTVEPVRLKPDILHLDCALGLLREGLMVVHAAGFLDGIPDRLKRWERIEVSADEARALGVNGLPVSPSVYITDPAFGRIADSVARHGITVETLDFSVTRKFGGSFRCSTQPLWRE